MKRLKIEFCKSSVNGEECPNIVNGEMFCHKHRNVCPSCRSRYRYGRNIFCSFCVPKK